MFGVAETHRNGGMCSVGSVYCIFIHRYLLLLPTDIRLDDSRSFKCSALSSLPCQSAMFQKSPSEADVRQKHSQPISGTQYEREIILWMPSSKSFGLLP